MSVNKEELAEMYLQQRLSIPDIAKATGIPKSTVRYYLLKHGVQLRRREEWMDLSRHKMGLHLKGKKRVLTEEHKQSLTRGRRRYWEGRTKGYDIHNGYKRLTQGENCGRLLHVVIMEEHIGRRIKKGEVVHHINENKLDNRIENLRLMTLSEHSRIHSIKRQKQGRCYDISKETRRGAENNSAKFTWEQVDYIRTCGKATKELMAEFSVSKSTINKVKSYKTYKLCQ